jgi:lipopolysaccharide/colanic/teichoic acid biosynthesis glycosyltransferase
MIKRIIDILLSTIGLIVFFPIIVITLILIWFQDFSFPFYTPKRMGKNMIPFKMYKFRSMIVNADKNGISSTSASDIRITPIGKIIRKYKFDEISQLINVFKGDMSLVGPRPQVIDHVINEYSELEKNILLVKPGITDISSIVFSDEGEILKDSLDPDHDYNVLIRPWKSRLALLYADNNNIVMDFKLIFITLLAIVNKSYALKMINSLLNGITTDKVIIDVCLRNKPLVPSKHP